MASTTAAQLAERRRALGLTQAMIAEMIRGKRVTLSYWETHGKIPERRAKQLDAVLSTLEVGYRAARAVAGEAGRP